MDENEINKLKNIKTPELNKNKNFLINSINNIWSTITDYISSFLGFQFFTNMSYNSQISNKVTSLFLNTKINVYVYESKIANAFTFPGIYEMNPLIYKSIEIFSLIPPLGNMIFLIMTILQSWRAIKSEVINIKSGFENGNLSTLIYDQNSKKLISGIKEATCYISSKMIDLMDNDDEIIAIILHEVGHNTMVFLNVFETLCNLGFQGYTFIEMIKFVKDNIYDSSLPMTNDIWKNIMQYIIIGIIVTYFLRYLRRRQEIYADEFAIKCGYGEATESAIHKLHNFIKNDSFFDNIGNIKNSLSFNFFDKILHSLNKLLFVIYDNTINRFNFGEYPQSDKREELIHNKVKNFDNTSMNINRSKHLEIAL